MGVFARISDIINANLNAILDKAENPDKMIRLIVAEMEDTLTEIKASAAEVVADRIRVERDLGRCTDKAADWNSKAELAVRKGREDLAREALEQRMALTRQAESLQTRLEELNTIGQQYQTDIGRIEEKLRLAYERQRALIASHKSLVNRHAVEERIYKVNTASAFARFDRYESRLDRLQAETEILADSNRSLEQHFAELEQDSSLDLELAALQEKVAAS